MTRFYNVIRSIQIGSGTGQRVAQTIIAALVPIIVAVALALIVTLIAAIVGADITGEPYLEYENGNVYEVTDPADWFVGVMIPSMILGFIGPIVAAVWFWVKSGQERRSSISG